MWEMLGSLVFGIEGYDHDPREVHSIPEIRRFYRAFHDSWPHWLFFCNLDTETNWPRLLGDCGH